MSIALKFGILALLTGAAIIGIFAFQPIAQPVSYHRFADTRTFCRIPNFGNVVSNLPFILIGIIGLTTMGKRALSFGILAMYGVLFIGVILTGLGSAYYHCNPNNDTLVWDRIPMTIVFMSLLSAVVAELISGRLGFVLLIPLVGIGVGSVIWWHYTETMGQGDLRLYFLVQFYPMLVIPLLMWLFYKPDFGPVIRCLVWVVIWYVVAKVFEQLDYPIYRVIGISGHTLKHLAAALSTWYFLIIFRLRHQRLSEPSSWKFSSNPVRR